VPEEMITEADREVFAHYGRTMLAVQAFEFTLYQLVQLQDEGFPEEGEFEEVWREHIEPLFKLTPGELKSRLRGADDALVEELGAAVDARNLLVHRFLFNYRLSAVTGASDDRGTVKELAELEERFTRVNRKLDSLADKLMHEKGLAAGDPGTSPGQLDQLLRGFRPQ